MKTALAILMLLASPAHADDKPLLPPNLKDLQQVGPKPEEFAQWKWKPDARYDQPRRETRWPTPSGDYGIRYIYPYVFPDDQPK